MTREAVGQFGPDRPVTLTGFCTSGLVDPFDFFFQASEVHDFDPARIRETISFPEIPPARVLGTDQDTPDLGRQVMVLELDYQVSGTSIRERVVVRDKPEWKLERSAKCEREDKHRGQYPT